jgi:hypothetical protein
MPTQIPVRPQHSYMVAAKAALLLSLLSASIDGVIVFIIVQAYRWFP